MVSTFWKPPRGLSGMSGWHAAQLLGGPLCMACSGFYQWVLSFVWLAQGSVHLVVYTAEAKNHPC